MSKRTKLKVRNFQIFLAKYVFNGRYIVRNILIATLLITAITMVVGISKISGDNVPEEETVKKEPVVEYSIDMSESQQLKSDSISILMADFDAGSQANVEANDTQVVSDSHIATGIVLDNGVYVRVEASYVGEVIETAYLDDKYSVDTFKSTDEWVCVVLEDGSYGYINAIYIQIIEEVQEETTEEAAQTTGEITEAGNISASTEEVPSNEAQGSITPQQPSQSTESATNAPTTESATNAPTTESTNSTDTTTEASKRDDTAVDGGVPVAVTYRDPITLSEDDINLMAAVLTLECGGESYDGQLAVANVIINRMQSGHWGNTVSDVVYAPYQFSCVSSPMLDYYIANGAQSSCVQAVKEALSGVNNIGDYMCFRATYITDVSEYDVYTVIGNHVFH